MYTQTIHIILRKENNTGRGKLGSAGRAPSVVESHKYFSRELIIRFA
jgi:hypothetical protein